MMPNFAYVGDFCPSQDCPDCRKLQVDQLKKNIKKAGKTQKGKQRYRARPAVKPLQKPKGPFSIGATPQRAKSWRP